MLESVESWALGEYQKAPSTVAETMRRLRRLVRLGLDLDEFQASPEEARKAGNAVLTRVKRLAGAKRPGSERGATRNAQKALNWLVDYQNRGDGLWQRWKLDPEPRPAKRRLTDAQVEAARNITCRTPFHTWRARAMIWLMEHTGLRRSELARARRQDIDLEACTLWVEYPAKGGRRRHYPLPSFASTSALAAYLAILPRRTPRDCLWVTRSGWAGPVAAMTLNGFSREMSRLSRRVGFRIGPTLYRRYRARYLHGHGVSVGAIKTLYDHAREATTWRYIGEMDHNDVLVELRRHQIPGFTQPTPPRPPYGRGGASSAGS